MIAATVAFSAAVPIATAAAGVFAAAGVLAAAGYRRAAHTVLCTAVLVGFFSVWVAGFGADRPAVRLALFAGAIATFRLMNRYEHPSER